MLYNKYFILSCHKHVRIKFWHFEKSATLHEIKGAFHSTKNSELFKREWMGRKFPWKVSEKCELGRRKSESICNWFEKISQSIIKTSDIFTQYLDQEECCRSNLSAICLFMFLLCYRKLLGMDPIFASSPRLPNETRRFWACSLNWTPLERSMRRVAVNC